jgi:hypothetical protein
VGGGGVKTVLIKQLKPLSITRIRIKVKIEVMMPQVNHIVKLRKDRMDVTEDNNLVFQ